MILNSTGIVRNQNDRIVINRYVENPVKENNNSGQLIEGAFYQAKPLTVREMLTRRINKSLCGCLIVTIIVTFISYYISMTYEAKLNNLDNEIVRINAENQDLQSELDRYHSFNNVDSRIGKFNLLQKADKVIEVTALNTNDTTPAKKNKSTNNSVDWNIGF